MRCRGHRDVAVVGEIGSGKSLLCRHIARRFVAKGNGLSLGAMTGTAGIGLKTSSTGVLIGRRLRTVILSM